MWRLSLLISICVSLFLSGCCTSRSSAYKRNPVSPDEIARTVIFNAADFRHKHNLFLEHSYTYTCPGQRQRLVLVFSSMDSVEMHEGRIELVDVVEQTVETINRDPHLQSQLWSPFTVDDLDVYISYISFNTLIIDPLYLGSAILENGTAFYYAAELNNKDTDYWRHVTEPYYKSKEFVEWTKQAEQPYIDKAKAKQKSALQKERLDGTTTNASPNILR